MRAPLDDFSTIEAGITLPAGSTGVVHAEFTIYFVDGSQLDDFRYVVIESGRFETAAPGRPGGAEGRNVNGPDEHLSVGFRLRQRYAGVTLPDCAEAASPQTPAGQLTSGKVEPAGRDPIKGGRGEGLS